MDKGGDSGSNRPETTSSFKRARLAGGKEFEHNLAIGVIASTKFLREIRETVQDNLRYIRNKGIKLIISWCFDYYDRYDRAPHLNIQDIFMGRKDELSPAEEDIIAEFLKKLSDKYRSIEDFEGEFEVGEVEAAIHSARMTEVLRQAGRLLEDRKHEEAYELVLKEGMIKGSRGKDLDTMILSLTEIIETEFQQSKMFMKPWLTSHSTNMIYGKRGIGKSWLTHLMAVAMTRAEHGTKVGGWKARKASVLLVDGEMPKGELQKRIKDILHSWSLPSGKSLFLLAEDLDLTQERQREALREIVQRREIEVMILDNISCLFPGIDENSKQDWDPINRWLLSLKGLGLGVVLIHHAGKQGKQRGTSGREDNLDTIIRLSLPKDYHPTEGARFWVRFEKARKLRPGASARGFQVSVQNILHGIEEVEEG